MQKSEDVKNASSAAADAVDPRIYFAAERTLLAWIRTGVAMMGFGFVVARFGLFLRELAMLRDMPRGQTSGLSLWFGMGLIVLGVVVNALAAWEYRRALLRLEAGEIFKPKRLTLGVLLAWLMCGLGIALGIYLLVVG